MNTVLYKLTTPIRKSSIKEFQQEHSEVGIGPNTDLRSFGYAWGSILEQPQDATKVAELAEPKLVGAFVEQGWTLRPKNAKETLIDSRILTTQLQSETRRRLNQPISFQEKLYQKDDVSQANIDRVATIAMAAISRGAQPNDYRWYDTGQDFKWIAADNSSTVMDAHTFLEFAQACAVERSNIVLASRKLKDMNPIPSDYRDDQYWT